MFRWMRLTHVTAPEQLKAESVTDVGNKRFLSQLNEDYVSLDATHTCYST